MLFCDISLLCVNEAFANSQLYFSLGTEGLRTPPQRTPLLRATLCKSNSACNSEFKLQALTEETDGRGWSPDSWAMEVLPDAIKTLNTKILQNIIHHKPASNTTCFI
jgi:hypothetical protein